MTENRHDRRAREARERRSNDTMGKSFQLGGLPASVLEHPAYKAGVCAGENGEGFPPAYFEDIKAAAALIRQWRAMQPVTPELRWLVWDAGRTFIAAGLDVGAQYLADSPDAFRLLAWLDEATGRKLSLNMAGWALRMVGEIPMPTEAA